MGWRKGRIIDLVSLGGIEYNDSIRDKKEKIMIFRIKRLMAWLVLSVMVLCMAAGCSVDGMGPDDTAAVGQTVRLETALGEQAGDAAGRTGMLETAVETDDDADDGTGAQSSAEEGSRADVSAELDEHGSYNTKDEVALYLHTYGRLPDNYITKKEAQELGWDSKKGNLTEVAPGRSIGGSHFGNYEGQLPEKDGRKYYECDLDYDGGYRGAERIIYSNDGLIFYTGDHYKTFEQLY